MKGKHTQGPWKYEKLVQKVYGRSVGGCSMQESDHMIADIRGWGHLSYLPDGAEIQDANGRLIAAAPDLLKVLQSLLPTLEDQRIADDARAAIAKATGEE